MSTEILCCRVHHDISAKVEWVLQKRRSECVVNAYYDLLLFCNFRHRLNVNNIHQRIRWRFHPQHPGAFIDRLRYVPGIEHINVMKLDTKFLKHLTEQPVSSTVHIITCYHFITG